MNLINPLAPSPFAMEGGGCEALHEEMSRHV